jgi:hypothetical protein
MGRCMHPDFLNNIFDNGMVLWVARGLLVSAALVLMAGGTYVVLSIFVRIRNREWLRRAGPFEVSEFSVEEFEGQADYWRAVAFARECEIKEADQALDETGALVKSLYDRLEGRL